MTDDSSLRSKEGDDERLIPGLPDEISFDHIVPKLQWKAFHVLSSVSCRWRDAIQSRHVYDARVRSHSTEKLLLLVGKESYENPRVISLYSVTDDSWRRLPKFPKHLKFWEGFRRGIPRACQCISLDGNIYVMGGRYLRSSRLRYGRRDDDEELLCSHVFVLDVAGQREWKQCANMPQPRYAFGCGIVDGKIYVFGGFTCEDKPAREALVYEPKADVWSSVQSMKYERLSPQVVAVGEELFVHGGIIEPIPISDRRSHDPLVTAEVYHAGKDEWRFLDLFDFSQAAAMFTTQGKVYMANPLGIYGQNNDIDGTHSWTRLHSILYGDKDDPTDYDVIAIQAINDELIGLLCWFSKLECGTSLCRSIGFGSKKEELAWDTIEDMGRYYRLMFHIEL